MTPTLFAPQLHCGAGRQCNYRPIRHSGEGSEVL